MSDEDETSDPDEVTRTRVKDRSPERQAHVGEREGEPEHEDLTGRTIAGRYKLTKLLGMGGMGAVYQAQHLALGVPVAVKTMHADVARSSEYVFRFRREARATSMLRHRNVVRVTDYGDADGVLYLVMDLLRGESVAEWLIRRRTPPPLAEVTEILLGVVDALGAAHGAGIVHRDLKPANVFLERESGGGRLVKVVDFGLARFDDPVERGPTLTHKDMVAGTPHYMSPEQCQSLDVGPSTDIYSVGVMLTEMLQLRVPFDGDTTMQILTRHMFWEVPPLDRPESSEPVPPLLERLRLDLLAKAASDRPRTMAEVRTRLVEATSLEHAARTLPPRKSSSPSGSRSERAPAWEHGPESMPDPVSVRAGSRASVAVVRLTTAASGVDEDCLIGLAAHGFLVKQDGSLDAQCCILDAGGDVQAARAWLEEQGPARAARTLACCSEASAETMGELIASGVADVLGYPITPDVLQRKLRRLLRRAARGR